MNPEKAKQMDLVETPAIIYTASQKRNQRRSLKRKAVKEMQASSGDKKDVSGDKEKPSSGDKEKPSSGDKEKPSSGEKEKPSSGDKEKLPPPPSSINGSRQGKILTNDEARVRLFSLLFTHPLVSEEEFLSPSSIICSRHWEYEARARLNNFLEKVDEEFNGFILNDRQREIIEKIASGACRGFEKRRARRLHELEENGKGQEPSSGEKLPPPPSPISGSRQGKILPEHEAKLINLMERVHENLKPFNLRDYQRQMIEVFARGARRGFEVYAAYRLHELEQKGKGPEEKPSTGEELPSPPPSIIASSQRLYPRREHTDFPHHMHHVPQHMNHVLPIRESSPSREEFESLSRQVQSLEDRVNNLQWNVRGQGEWGGG